MIFPSFHAFDRYRSTAPPPASYARPVLEGPACHCGGAAVQRREMTSYDRVGLVDQTWSEYFCGEHAPRAVLHVPWNETLDCAGVCSPEQCGWPVCRQSLGGAR